MLTVRTIAICIALIVSLAIIVLVRSVVHDETLAEIRQDALRNLDIQSFNVRAITDKYAITAKMLARRHDILSVFDCHHCQQQNVSRLLSQVKAMTGARSIWLVDQSGQVLVTSEVVMESQSVAGSDYFQASQQGRLGRATIVDGIVDRAYVLAAPVFVDHRVVGAAVVLVEMASIESSWALIQHPIVALNDEQKIFLANVKKWQFLQLVNRQEDKESSGLFHRINQDHSEGWIAGALQAGDSKRFVLTEKSVPLLNWNLIAMRDYAMVTRRVNEATVSALMVLLLLWTIAWFIWNRNQRIVNERNQQIEFANLLEQRVERRTQAVSIANKKLESEVEERKAAEMELRRTQKELIQAAKMASIGQMSTVLAHEYNQPISAIQFYADSAKKLFQESRETDGFDNLERIGQLTQRMSTLTNSLRKFAHKPKLDLKVVDIEKVINQLMVLMQPLAKSQNVEIVIQRPAESLTAIAGDTRLTQILSNLVTNSIDALRDQQHKVIDLEWREKDSEWVEVIVRDNGPGVNVDLRENIFEAFYTTKNSGEGLGLGLFIVYNLVNEIGGRLKLVDEEGYGAVFVLTLKRS